MLSSGRGADKWKAHEGGAAKLRGLMRLRKMYLIAAAIASCATILCIAVSAQGASGAASAAGQQPPPAGFSMPEPPSSTVYFAKRIDP